jgi:hypothetical protein
MQQVVVETHLEVLGQGKAANREGERDHKDWAVEPDPFNFGPALDAGKRFWLDRVLRPAQQEHGQQCHHRHEADNHAAAADHAHFLNPAEVSGCHCQKRTGRGQASRDDAQPSDDQGFPHCFFHGLAALQFLLVACNQVDTEVDRDADEDRRERDGQDVEMPDYQRREGHGVHHTNDQSHVRLDPSADLAVAEDDDQEDQHESHDGGQGGVALRLCHLVKLEDGFASHPHVKARHLPLGLGNKFPQSPDGVLGVWFLRGPRGDEINPAGGEGDVLLALGFLCAVEKRVHARRERGTRSPQTVSGCIHDAAERGQGLDEGLIVGVRRAGRLTNALVDLREEAFQIRRYRELLDERPVVTQRFS